MLDKDLQQFFKDNTQELPDTAQAWFRVPNEFREMLQGLDPVELLKMVKGKELDRWSGRPDLQAENLPEDTQQSIEEARKEVSKHTERRRFPEAIRVSNELLDSANQEQQPNSRDALRIAAYDLRAGTADHIVFKGPLQRLPGGEPEKAWAALSAVIDFMRIDITAGFVTKQFPQMADCFGAAGMTGLQYRVWERVLGRRPTILYSDTGNVVDTLYIPRSPELATMHRNILSRLS